MTRAFWTAVFLAALVPQAFADVVAHDAAAVAGSPVLLVAETRGRLLARGGELVEFVVGGVSLGTGLSGGDGRAIREYRPRTQGLVDILVRSGGSEDKGRLLVLGRGDKAVLIDVERAVFGDPFMLKERPGASDAITKIMIKFKVVYLSTGVTGERIARAALQRAGLPPSVVLPAYGGESMRKLMAMGAHIAAVVGSEDVMDPGGEDAVQWFSFEESGAARVVGSWERVAEEIGGK
jgi:hypothetical protein